MKQPFCAPAAALRRVLDAAAALPRPAVETLPLEKACGRIAAKALCARMDQPPLSPSSSPLDGYALHSADTAGASRETPVTLPVTMKLYAGDAPAAALPVGCAAPHVMTGAPLPEGADCVLMQELTDSGEETVQLYSSLKPQQNVVLRGGDIAAGAIIAAAGTALTPAHLGVLAGQGYAEVPVYRTLTVGILSTGSELLAPGEPWAPGKIYDANGIQNAARLGQLGFAVQRRHCSDDPEVIACQLRELLTGAMPSLPAAAFRWGRRTICPPCWNAACGHALCGRGPEARQPHAGGKVSLASWCSACPATPLPQRQRWNSTPSRPCCGRQGAGRRLHPSPHHPHPDHRLFQVQQGKPLSAGKAAGGSVTIPGEGNAEAHSSGSLSAMIGCNCLVELPRQRPGGSGRRSGGA